MKVYSYSLVFAAASLALISATLPADDQPPRQATDTTLERARKSTSGMMFADQLTTKAAENRRDLVITSAWGEDGTPETVRLRPGTTRIFRAGPGQDEFTKQGGWHWRFGKTEGQSQFKRESAFDAGRGPLVMVVYEMDGTVHWYRLIPDFRC